MPQYVAMGSSFAAGSGLGARAPGTPWLYMKTVNGYPQQLARLLGLGIVDVTCGGAKACHVLRGGQYFQGPQIAALDARTELVTLTIGGNDIGYSGDLILLSRRARTGVGGFLLRHLWRGAKLVEQRPFARLSDEILAILRETRQRAPQARVIVVTYPSLVPRHGTCAKLGITEAEAALMRAVGDRLAEVTRTAAHAGGATIVDMATLSVGFDACADTPWVNGAYGNGGVPFHPNLAGAAATAGFIADRIGR